MKYLKIRIEVGTSDSTFDIYYDSISSGTRALLYDTGLDAVGLTNEELETGEGITVSVPDGATSIVLSSSPAAFCTENPDVNEGTYTIPIGCMSYTISAPAGIFNYFYTDCNCNQVTATIDATYGYTEETFCALQDSVSAGVLTVVDNGYCSAPTPTPTPTSIPTNVCYEILNDSTTPQPCYGCENEAYSIVRTTLIRFLDGCGGTPISPTSNMTVVTTYSNGGTQTTEISSGSPAGYIGVGGSDTQCGPNCTEYVSPFVVSVQVTSQSEGVISQCC